MPGGRGWEMDQENMTNKKQTRDKKYSTEI